MRSIGSVIKRKLKLDCRKKNSGKLGKNSSTLFSLAYDVTKKNKSVHFGLVAVARSVERSLLSPEIPGLTAAT